MGPQQGCFCCPRLPGPQFSTLEVGETAPFLLPLGGAGASDGAPPTKLLCPAAQRILAWHSTPLWAVQPGGAPAHVISAGKQRPVLAGASLGCRRRHVLDTGLSGLEPPHKGRGRRRNKGLFHAAAEKPQISSLVLHRRGGPAAFPPRPLPHSITPPISLAWGLHVQAARESLIIPEPTPSLLLKIPLSLPSPQYVKPLNSVPWCSGA